MGKGSNDSGQDRRRPVLLLCVDHDFSLYFESGVAHHHDALHVSELESNDCAVGRFIQVQCQSLPTDLSPLRGIPSNVFGER